MVCSDEHITWKWKNSPLEDYFPLQAVGVPRNHVSESECNTVGTIS